jgi:regulator of protease activity HflC (stomatin/prohibitin superfamily)
MKRTNMFRWFAMALILMFAMSTFTGCGRQKVKVGWECVKISQYGSDKGVDTQTLGVGKYWYNSIKFDMMPFPLFKQNVVWTQDSYEGSPKNQEMTFQDDQGLPYTANIGLSFMVVPGAGATLVTEYRKGIDEIVDIDMRNAVRDALVMEASIRTSDQLMGSGKEEFMLAATERLQIQFAGLFEIRKLYLIGKLTPPGSVAKGIALKMEAQQLAQQRQNEIVEATAAAAKIVEAARGDSLANVTRAAGEGQAAVLRAVGEAEAIKLVRSQLTPAYVDYLYAIGWNGVLPLSTGGGALPLLDLPVNE